MNCNLKKLSFVEKITGWFVEVKVTGWFSLFTSIGTQSFLFLSGKVEEVWRGVVFVVWKVCGGECQVLRSPATISATFCLCVGCVALLAYARVFWAKDSCWTIIGAPASESESLWNLRRELLVNLLFVSENKGCVLPKTQECNQKHIWQLAALLLVLFWNELHQILCSSAKHAATNAVQ